MSLTLPELKQRLALKDPEEILDILQLNDSEALVEVLSDYIEENYEALAPELAEEEFGHDYDLR